MKFSKSVSTLSALALAASTAKAAFDINSNNNLVMYWGQSSAGSEQSLGDYCAQTAGDIYVLSFLYEFGSGTPTLNIGSCYDTFEGSTLLHCPDIASDIKSCQAAGKKVLLSLGGAVGQYGFSSDSEAETFAGTLWNLFGGGSSDTRPFDDAIVDGFDLDIENGDSTGYVALVNTLRTQYFNSANKDYYISTAPQCPYPDANVGDVLANANIDFAFIQFYNNYCSIGPNFNWNTWHDFAQNTSPNKNIKLFLGLPGSTSAAGSGYQDPSTIASTVASISSDPNFAGIMLWDASQGFTNTVNGISFAQSMQNILDGQGSNSGSNSGSNASPSVATSAKVTTSQKSTASPSIVTISPSKITTSPSTIAASTFAVSINSGLGQQTGLTLIASVPTTPVAPASQLTTVTKQVTVTTKNVIVATTSSAAVTSANTNTGSCNESETSCIDGKYSVCNFGQWVNFDCPAGTVCLVAGSEASCGYAPSKRDTFVYRRHKHHNH